ncbi:MAG: penicillin-binding protein 2 [Rhodospirillales bacterium]
MNRQRQFSFTYSDVRLRFDENLRQALETGRNRLLVAGAVFGLAFLVIAVRIVNLAVMEQDFGSRVAGLPPSVPAPYGRSDIVDRNGVILATSLPSASLYADPSKVLDAGEAAEKLAQVLPGLNPAEVLVKLQSKGRFVWLRRNLTPQQLYLVNRLGLPGLFFNNGERRIYPHGRLASHLLGFTDVDGNGIAGIERYFDQVLRRGGDPIKVSVDIRVQAILHEELSAAMKEFNALGAAGLILDVNNGETLAMVSLPDFDSNAPNDAASANRFNRVTKGVYEMGSTFKLFNTAMALDSGTVTLDDGYDASKPIRISRFTITDFHGKDRWLTVPEILVYSSNIGSAKMALDMGTTTQRTYLDRFGLISPASIELPEVGSPLIPPRWRDINTMTISYGHGIAVSPLQIATAVTGLVNGGVLRPSTLLKQQNGFRPEGTRILSAETSRNMRSLMRMVVTQGTGSKADARGYPVGGKTGTADKMTGGGYRSGALISSFIGVFPIYDPKYVVLTLLDEPKGNEDTFNYATGGWVAAPVVRRVVQRMGPLLGVPPELDDEAPALNGASRLAFLGQAQNESRERVFEAH